jgi:hypothetical protein
MEKQCAGQQIADDCQDNIDANDAYDRGVQRYIDSNLNSRMLSDSVGYSVYPGGVIAEAVQEDHDDIDRLFTNALRIMVMNPGDKDGIEAAATMLGCEMIRVGKQHLMEMTTAVLRNEADDEVVA